MSNFSLPIAVNQSARLCLHGVHQPENRGDYGPRCSRAVVIDTGRATRGDIARRGAEQWARHCLMSEFGRNAQNPVSASFRESVFESFSSRF